MANNPLVGWVPSPKRSNDEGIKKHAISLPILVLCQRRIFLLLVLSCGLEGSIPVLERYGDIYNGHRFAGLVDYNKVWSEGPIKARYRLVDSDGGGGRSIKSPH